MLRALNCKNSLKLTFDAHINGICKKAGLKLNAIARNIFHIWILIRSDCY